MPDISKKYKNELIPDDGFIIISIPSHPSAISNNDSPVTPTEIETPIGINQQLIYTNIPIQSIKPHNQVIPDIKTSKPFEKPNGIIIQIGGFFKAIITKYKLNSYAKKAIYYFNTRTNYIDKFVQCNTVKTGILSVIKIILLVHLGWLLIYNTLSIFR